MAKAFPSSRFVGFDYHDESIRMARQRAVDAGVTDRVRFEVASAGSFPGSGYDLVTMFDCLHDMGDPVGAARHVREVLAADGTWLLVEPYAGDAVEDNLNPVGRVYYGASTLVARRPSVAGYPCGVELRQRASLRCSRTRRDGQPCTLRQRLLRAARWVTGCRRALGLLRPLTRGSTSWRGEHGRTPASDKAQAATSEHDAR
jgi:SAM-dependent methyltransferase